MTVVVVLRGLPASGKSTWTKALVASKPAGSVARINNDDLVDLMFPHNKGHRVEGLGELLHHVRLDLLARLIAANLDTVVIDNTNLSVDTVGALESAAIAAGASFVVNDEFLSVPVQECVRRDSLRDFPVGKEVIEQMAREAAELKPWVYNEGNPPQLSEKSR